MRKDTSLHKLVLAGDTLAVRRLVSVFCFHIPVALYFCCHVFIFYNPHDLLLLFRWEDNIKMDLQEVGGGCGYWMELAQDRDRWRALVSTMMNLRVP